MRKIIHVDMDCFYAAIEMRNQPQLYDKPLAIGSVDPRRGVLCTCNYVAREYGVRAAMPTFKALEKCPQLVILPPAFDSYKQESQAIRHIFKQYTEVIEPLSLDEAYLDVTDSELFRGSATLIAKDILQTIYQQRQLTASAGVGPNKLIAKIASDENKPNGLGVVPPEQVADFLKPLPIRKLFGVGPKLAQKLNQCGIETCEDLKSLPLHQLTADYGKMGVSLYQYSRGVDNRAVMAARKRKSLSVEWTFSENINKLNLLEQAVQALHKKLIRRWQLAGEPAYNKIFVKVKSSNFELHSHEQSALNADSTLFCLMIKKVWQKHQQPIRLLGIGYRLKEALEYGQLEFDYNADE